MSRVLDLHRRMLDDPRRLALLDRAVRSVVHRGDVVVDLASGTGILGLMAARAGAARVYSIDEGGIIDVARALARANGLADRMTFVMAHSLAADLPERADVVIADQIGHFGFEAGLVEFFADARRRFLKPGGRIMPQIVRMIVGLVESEDIRSRIAFWSERAAGFDLASGTPVAQNTGYTLELTAADLLSEGRCAGVLDVRTAGPDMFRVHADLTASRNGTLDAIGGWFIADLVPGVTMTNAPSAPDRISRQHVAFPLGTTVTVATGDRVRVDMRVRPADHLVRWTVDVRDGELRIARSTLNGMLLPAETLNRTRPEFVPRLNRRGQARQTVLGLCDGVRSVAAIERELFDRYRDLFPSFDAAQTFVAEVVTRYSA
jgi:protein arginine N-methyltransferase 1